MGKDAMKRDTDKQSWDALLAARSGAALFLLGALLLVTMALPQADPPPLAATLAVGVAAAAAGVALLVLHRRACATLDAAFAFNLAAVAMIALLVALSGGSTSLYPEYYLFVLVHTAAFQPRGRVLGMVAVSVVAFLAPLAYDAPDAAFATLAIVAIPPVVVAVAAVHAAMEALRAQHRRLERREAHALALADQDPLTRLANYRVFQREIEAWARDESAGFSLVLLDLDGFKAINDEIGHQMGDAVLLAVAAELRHAVRAQDVLCRQGGDEFAVLAPRAGPREAPELAERLVAAVERAGAGGAAGRPTLSATCGWATFGRDASTPAALIARADAAMRAAKPSAQGGRRVAAA
jgi:diguanylate cyclase (GGDEF)-like protein